MRTNTRSGTTPTSTDTPLHDAPFPVADRRDRERRVNNSDKARERKRRYKSTDKGAENKRRQEDREYLAREFIAWDGEGFTDDSGTHLYTLLASSDGDRTENVNGIGTADAFELLLSCKRRNPRAIMVGYGLGYDVNMILRDLTTDLLHRLYKTGSVRWLWYRIAWRDGKTFRVERDGVSVTLYDVISFFQCSFVKACDQYLGTEWENRAQIIAGKAARGSFTAEDAEAVADYNAAELRNLVRLMEELRLRLFRVGMLIRRWDGPGAVAAQLMSNQNVKAHMRSESDDDIRRAVRTAYAGGRFEVMQFGHVLDNAYEYDVNSAYPSALRELPSLADGTWQHVNGDPGDQPFAIYRVQFSGYAMFCDPSPFWIRTRLGTIHYPRIGEGWYWSPEVAAVRKYRPDTFAVVEAYVFEPATDVKPFAFVEPLYLKRQALKRGGDGAHVGIKLGLNSLYGKLAQQVGWRPARNGKPAKLPPFHQLEYAGFVTSHCRAAVWSAIASDPGNVIAFETDAVFTRKPIDVPIGSGLGQFELTEFSSLTYVKSGTYFGTLTDGTEVSKTRGVDLGTLTRADVVNAWEQNEKEAVAQSTRFNGAGIALTQGMHKWRRWETSEKHVYLGPQGKRIHYDCAECAGYDGFKLGIWHASECAYYGFAVSEPFPIEWETDSAVSTEYAELRRTVEYHDWN